MSTPKADYDRLIALGLGDVMTSEGFTIRETRDILYGDDSDPYPFEGLVTLVMKDEDDA